MQCELKVRSPARREMLRCGSDRLLGRLAPERSAGVAADHVVVDTETVPLGVLHAVREESELSRLLQNDSLGAYAAPLPLDCARLHELPLTHDLSRFARSAEVAPRS